LFGAITSANTQLASAVPNEVGGDRFSQAGSATRQPVLSMASLYPED
jgi:hypothetical protein